MWKEIGQDKFLDHEHFFERFDVNQTMIDSTFSGYTPGRLFVSEKNGDMLLLANFGFAFGVTQDSFDFLKELSERDHKTYTFIPRKGLKIEDKKLFKRLGFKGISSLDNVKKILARDLSSFELGRLDASNGTLSSWPEVIEGIFGSIENFGKAGGFTLLDGEIIAAESMIGFKGKDNIEIGTITHEKYRGKGLSTYICAYLVKDLVDKGFSPYWSCNASNIGSKKVAENLGFNEPFEYDAIPTK